jgi:hypothetical protein
VSDRRLKSRGHLVRIVGHGPTNLLTC